jgi:HAD superfamily hydrolase (TIGR01662 family)
MRVLGINAIFHDPAAAPTSDGAVIPAAAIRHRLRGLAVHRRARSGGGSRVVLFDRDGARIGVVSNQSGVAKGRVTIRDVRRISARVEEFLGRFDVWEFCPHDGCECRKPRPGMTERAAERLGVPPSDCAVIGCDVEAAGARGIFVPTGRTRWSEIATALETAPTLAAAVDLVLGGRRRR